MALSNMLRSPYRDLEKALGYRFRRRAWLEMALTHPSFRHETQGAATDNQRLEFLGDAVLGLVVADHLFAVHATADEGALTDLRSSITNTRALARVAQAIALGQHLRLGHGEQQSGGARRTTTLADALEAVLGAAFRDGGLKAVQKIFRHLFQPLFEQPAPAWAGNPKGALQELFQKSWKSNPVYRVTRESGPAHERTYTMDVLRGAEVIGTGTGVSKRAAAVEAARHALERLRATPPGA
ncbi:MAG: ribonuclease III [Kiritimatiellaeota bacterium]|nr:ribonuclease III [Kiritimatiellota bacterium]